MSDGLKIEVDADRTAVELMTASIDKLILSVDKLVGASSKTASVSDAFAGFKIDPNVEKALEGLTESLKKLSQTRIDELQKQIADLKPENVQQLSESFGKLSQVTNALQSGNITQMSSALKATASTAPEVMNLGTALQNFWKEAANAATGSQGLRTATSGLATAFGEVRTQAGGTSQGIAALAGSFGGLSTVLAGLGVAAAVTAIFKLGEALISLGPAILTVTEQYLNLTATINAVSAGTGEAAFASLRATADATGQSVGALSRTFTQFVAGASTIGQSTAQAASEFQKLTLGFRGAGASSQETTQAMNALVQMMGKGKVQAQELVIQLGNASPVALKKLADSLHTTTAGLLELSKSGSLLPTDIISKFADEMERSFGSAISARLMTVSAQVEIMNNKFADLGRAVGQGTFVGLETGLAQLIKGFNSLLDVISPITTGLAALAGTIAGAVLGSIGLLIQGFSNIVTGVESAVAYLAGLAKAAIDSVAGFDVLKGAASAIQKTFEDWGISFDNIGQRFGKLAEIAGTLAAGLLLLAPAVSLVKGAYGLLAAGLEIVVAWKNRAVIATVALLAATNPLQAAIAVAAAAAAGAAAAYLLYGNGVDKAAQESAKFKASTDGVAYGAEKLAAGGQAAATAALNLATAFLSSSGAASALAQEHEKLAQSEAKVKAEMQAHAAEMKNLERGQQSLIREYEAAKNANAQEILDLQNKKSRWQDMDKAIQAASSSTKGAGHAAAGAADDYSQLDRRIRDLGRDSKQIEIDMKNAQDSFKDRMDREKEYQDGLKATQDRLKETVDWEKKYGVTSNETTREIVQLATAIGENAKTAGAIASAYNTASAAARDFKGALNDEVQKNEQLIANRTTLINKIGEVIAKLKEQEDAARQAGDAMKGDALKKAAEGLTTFWTNLKNANAETIQMVIAQKALRDSGEDTGKTFDLIKKYAQEYADATGKSVDVTKLAEQAQGKLGDAAKELAKGEGLLGKDAENATEKLKKQAEELKPAAENAGKFADLIKESSKSMAGANVEYAKLANALTTISSSFEKIKDPLASMQGSLAAMKGDLVPVAEGFNQIGPALDGVAASVPVVADAFKTIGEGSSELGKALPEIAAGFEAVVEPINGLAEPIMSVSDAFDSMAVSLPPVAATFVELTTAMTELVEPLNSVNTALSQMSTYDEGLRNTADAAMALSEALKAIATTADEVKPKLDSLIDPTLSGVSKGFETARENTEKFGAALDGLKGNVDSLISKLQELIDKAKEAMQAAQAAASAGASSGGGGSYSDVAQQREGGYAGQGPTTSVSHTAFANAPQFASGTANTSNYAHALSNGGIPSILHPNEAVIPLSKGRSVPVELSHTTDNAAISTLVKGIVSGLSDTYKSHAEAVASNPVADARRANTQVKELKDAPTQTAPQIRQNAAVDYASNVAVQSGPNQSSSNPGSRATTPSNAPVHIHMNISTPDADSFRKSKDQIHAEMFNKMKTAFNKNA